KFTPEQKEAALEAAGLLDPIGEQLIHFYGQLLHLDFGTSRRIQNGIAVTRVIGSKVGVSIRMGLISFGISLVIGLLLGIAQAAFKGKFIDWLGTVYTSWSTLCPLWWFILWYWCWVPNIWDSRLCIRPVMSPCPACYRSSVCRWH